MIDEIQKSIKANLYERVTSPLIGALVISWIVTNWKVLYITLFEDNKTLNKSKIQYVEDYILNNSLSTLLIYPIVGTIFILIILPFLSEGAFWLKEWFKARKLNIKIKAENKVPLTLDESIKLRKQLRELQNEFNHINIKREQENLDLIKRNKDLVDKNSENLKVLESYQKSSDSNRKQMDYQNNQINELRTLIDLNKENILDQYNSLLKNYQKDIEAITKSKNFEIIQELIKKYNSSGLSKASYFFSDISDNEKHLLIRLGIMSNNGNENSFNYQLTDLGKVLALKKSNYIPK